MLVLGLDVGSVNRKGGFAWASSDGRLCGEDDPSALGSAIVYELDAGRRVALAVESPVSVPVPDIVDDKWRDLGKARSGERNRPWSAGAGAGSLATGLVQLTWLCRYIAERSRTRPKVTTQLQRFLDGADLFLTEAMVTSDGKPATVDGRQDYADALAAAKRLDQILAEARTGSPAPADVRCAPLTPLNLAAVAALHGGLAIDLHEIHLDVLVAKVRPIGR